MLKLTNSFYRCLTVTCEKVDYKAHVKNYSHLNRIGVIRKASCVDLKLKKQYNCSSIQQKHQLNKQAMSKSKKGPRTKTQATSSNQAEQMSEPVDVSHATYGGTFVVSSDDSDSSDEDFRKPTPKSRRANKAKIPPNFRSWENILETDEDNTFKFKVVSYNVLAQDLLEGHAYLYTSCAAKDLKWRARSARLYDEIVTLAPDILCLQEVQVSHLNSFYSKFEKMGYKSVFKRRTGLRQDGCAIYYRKSMFTLKEHLSVEFLQPQLPLLNRDNIGVMVKLLPRCAPNRPIVVATTHLIYNPKRADVRLAQMQVFLAEIDRFSFYRKGTESGHLPIILTGDFNSGPNGEVIRLLNQGHVPTKTVRDNSDWEKIGVTDNCQHLSVYLNRRGGRSTDFRKLKIYNSEYSETRPEPAKAGEPRASGPYNLLFNSGDLWQSLQLSSVYEKYLDDPKSEVSTYQGRWVIVDYIFYSPSSSIKLCDRLRLPAADECKVLKRLPNEVFASDHLALGAVFAMALPRAETAQ